MRPIRTTKSNFTYKGASVGPDCADLPCEVDKTSVTAVFKLTDAERQQIANGANFEIVIFQHPMPPISVGPTTEENVEQWEQEDMVCESEDCGSVWLAERNMEHCGHCGSRLVPALLAN